MSIFNTLFGSGTTSGTSRTQLEGPAREAVTNLIERTTQFANQPYTPYTYPREAGFTPDQLQAFQSARNIAGNAQGIFGNLLGDVSAGVAQGQQVWDPMSAGLAGGVAGMAGDSAGRLPFSDLYANTAGGLAGLGSGILSQSLPTTAALGQRFPGAPIEDYMNPYVQQVLAPAMRDLERRAENERLALTDRAAQTGAFGGSRNAIAQGMQQRSAMEEMGRLSANERAKAFNEGANQWRLDQQRLPELFNNMFGQVGAAQGLGQIAQNMNTQAIQDRGLAQQQGLTGQQAIQNVANLQATRYNAQNNLLAANQGLIGSQVNPLLATGGLQQALNQANLDTMYGDFVEQRDWDRRGIDALIRTLGLAAPTSQTTTTSQTAPRPNALGQVLGAGVGILGAIGGSGGVGSGLSQVGNWVSGLFG